MPKYFNNCKNFKEMRIAYLTLMKKYHPDLTQSEEEKLENTRICAEINSEYEMFAKLLPKEAIYNNDNNVFSQIICNDAKAGEACEQIMKTIVKPRIDYDYYQSFNGVLWWEEAVLNEIDQYITAFWSVCYAKNIVGEKFAKLYELCGFNTEKMRRVVMFLATGAIPDSVIHTNLTSSNATPFFDDTMGENSLPSYEFFLLLCKDYVKEETITSWISFCQMQRDVFLDRYNENVIGKLQV